MADTVKRTYGNFRGVDLRGLETDLGRSPDSRNVWRDYRQTERICTRPAMALYSAWPGKVYGIFFCMGEMLVHCADTLYRVRDGERSVLYSGLREAVSEGFAFDHIWYFKDGKHYLQYDGDTVTQVAGYVPTTSIGRTPAGNGTAFEEANLLTGMRRNSFLGDEMSFAYYLDVKNIDPDVVPEVIVEGTRVTDFTVDHEKGMILFAKAPPAPQPEAGEDNVFITFSKTYPGYRQSILGCTLVQVFDNRVFVSGNPEHPNTVWHCALRDPSWFSELDYYREGMDESAVRGLVAGNNALWVFREPSDANTNVFYHTPTLDSDYGKIYPSSHSSVAAGCVGRAVNFHDDIVFFSGRGMEGISGNINTEQAIAHRSSLVDRVLTASHHYRDMLLAEWEGYLLVFLGKRVLLADSRSAFRHTGSTEYDWYDWELEKAVTCVRVLEGVLYLGTEDGVYTLTDSKSPVESWWTTPKDRFGWQNRWKSTGRRGCIVEAAGDLALYARTDKTDFSAVGVYENITDHIVVPLRYKRFKDLQLKFYSKTRFHLETVSLECYAGGYIRR